MNRISEFIVELRLKNNLNQKQLANMINVSQQTVSLWESGSRTPKLRHAILLCEKLNVNIEEVIRLFSSIGTA